MRCRLTHEYRFFQRANGRMVGFPVLLVLAIAGTSTPAFAVCTPPNVDNDNDGYCSNVDYNDNNPNITGFETHRRRENTLHRTRHQPVQMRLGQPERFVVRKERSGGVREALLFLAEIGR